MIPPGFFSIHLLVKRPTDIGANWPELDSIQPNDRRVLTRYRPEVDFHNLMHIEGDCVSGNGYGVSIRCYGTSVGRHAVCVQSQLGLWSEWLTIAKRGTHPTHIED